MHLPLLTIRGEGAENFVKNDTPVRVSFKQLANCDTSWHVILHDFQKFPRLT